MATPVGSAAYPVGSAELRVALEAGVVQQQGRALAALPRGLVEQPDGQRVVEFDLVDPKSIEKPGLAAVWFTAIRAVSLTAVLTPCIAVLLFGLAMGWDLRLPVALASMVGVVLLLISVNLLNDVEDYYKMIDLPGSLGGAGVIQKGWLSARQVRNASFAALGAGLLLGVPAFVLEPKMLLVIGLLALVGSFGYSGRPFGFKYRALGDLTVFLLCGPGLTAGFAAAAFSQGSNLDVLALGVYFGAAACGILHVNNLQDIDVDRARGAATLASMIGESASKLLLVIFYLVAYAAGVYVWFSARLPVWTLALPLLSLIPVTGFVVKLLRAPSPAAPGLELARVTAAQMHLLMGVSLSIGLGIALALR